METSARVLEPSERAAMGQRMRAARLLADKTLRSVAAELGVTPNAVSCWEHGTLPTGDLRERVAEIYKVDPKQLFGEYYRHVIALNETLTAALGNGST